jgi:hypothetical protein
MEAIASHNPWSSLAEDEEDNVANMYPSRNNALVLLNTKASGLKMVCHKIAEEIESHNSGKPSGPLIVTGKLRHSINACRKAWRKVLALLKDPLAHDVEINEAEAAHLASTKRAWSLVSILGVQGLTASLAQAPCQAPLQSTT